MRSGCTIAVLIPALNEAGAIREVISTIPSWVDRVVVADNGSTDETASIAGAAGASVVSEPRRGYGAACLAGLRHLAGEGGGLPHIIVFLDGDRSDSPDEMAQLVDPIAAGEGDLVLGSRVLGAAEPGSLTLPQRLGNRLATILLQRLWGLACTDLGPFRAIRREALAKLAMDDLDFGWTVQMQVRAAKLGLGVREVPVNYRNRIGKSKISGTVIGTIRAGYRILATIGREALADGPAALPRRLLVFTRQPEPGTTKTRLIPHLGAEGAAELQMAMTRHVLDVGRAWAALPGNALQVRITGGTAPQRAATFGGDLEFAEQGEGDLGHRLERAFDESFKAGCRRVVVIGSDCPEVGPDLLRRAFDVLDEHDVVLGPARDGGYYLLGLRWMHRALFKGVDWGSERVLEQTRQRIRRQGLSCAELPVLSDVDEASDLPVWEKSHQEIGSVLRSKRPRYSIIIPTLNEREHLPAAIASARQCPEVEIIVADGGSTDATVVYAECHADRVVTHSAHRAGQMNAAAAVARGDVLLFLHADTRLPFEYAPHVERALAGRGVVAGAFRFGFDLTCLSLRLIEAATACRARWFSMPYGDQALFMPRASFERMGGFAEVPVMEDYDLVRRLQQAGRIAIAPATALTSTRRWLTHGVWRTTLNHQRMLLGWHLGFRCERLAQWRSRTGATAPVPPCSEQAGPPVPDRSAQPRRAAEIPLQANERRCRKTS